MQAAALALLQRYFDALNAGDFDALGELLAPHLIHDTQSECRELARAAFVDELRQAQHLCREHHYDLELMCNADGSRAAAEYTVLGVYLDADVGEAAESGAGQIYRLSGGTFFELERGRICRITQHSNALATA